MALAVITGGASGFGLALGDRAAALGFEVLLLDRDGDRANDEAGALSARRSVSVRGGHIDVSDGASVEAAAEEVAARWGAADLVISNVGVQLFGAVETFTDDEWAWVLDVNVIGSARVARAFLPLLRAAPAPHLAFTTSTSVLDVASRLGAYQASKFAVWGLAETLRLELAADGIGVTVVLPSGMLSRHLESSEAAQPSHVRRPAAGDGDLDEVVASNPAMASMLAMPDDASDGVVEAILRGDRYVITHGDLTGPIANRSADLSDAAVAALQRRGMPDL